MHRSRLFLGIVIAFAAVPACGSKKAGSGDAGADGRTDARADTGTEARTDAGAEAGTDAGTEARADAGPDTRTDAGAEAGTDADIDASTDAGMDAGAEAGADAGMDAWTAAGAGDGPGDGSPDQGPLQQPVVLVGGQTGPCGLAIDAANVYWTTSSGNVMKAPIGGGAAATLAAGQSHPCGIAVDGARVYWVNSDSSGQVMSVPTAGGTATALASDQGHPAKLAIHAGTIYWTNQTGGTVMALPETGGTPAMLADHQATPVAITVDANTDTLYWSSFGASAIRSLALNPLGTVVTLFDDHDAASNIQIRNGVAYWTSGEGGEVKKAPAAGGAPVVIGTGMSSYGIAVDDRYVYWTDDSAGTVMRVALVGGVPVTLATNQAQPSEIVVDDRNIYWLDSTDDGAVMVLAKDAGPARPEIMVVATIFGGVSSFTLDATSGVPTAAPRSPVDPGIQLYAVAAHPSGDFVYGADFRGRIYGYRVNRGDGSLDSLSGLPLIIGGQAVSAAVDPLGRFLYVGNNGDNNLYAFTIAPSTGALTPATGSPFALGATPAGVAFAPSGAFAYISTGPSATDGGGIHVFTVDGTSGKPTELATSPFVQTLFAGALVMHPSGKFLYDTAFGVHALSIDPTTGAVTGEMAGSPHPGASSDNQAIDVALDPGGGHLYASAQAGTVTAYSIDTTTGVFGSVPGSPFAAGTLPYALAVDPTGRFVYVGNDDAQQVSVFSIAPGNGALQPVGQPITVPGLQPEIVIIRSEP